MNIDFKGKTVLITGAASGAGTKILDQFAKCGADIAFTYLHSDPNTIIEQYPDLKIRGYRFDQKDISSIPWSTTPASIRPEHSIISLKKILMK